MTEPTEADGKLEFVDSELKRQLALFSKRRRRDKRKGFGLKVSTVALSAIITVLLGLRHISVGVEAIFANIALGLGASVTVLAAVDAFFSHRGLWILRTNTVRELEAISRDLAFYKSGLSGEPDACEVDSLYARLSDAIQGDFDAWKKLRSVDAATAALEVATPSAALRESPPGRGQGVESDKRREKEGENGNAPEKVGELDSDVHDELTRDQRQE